MTQPATNEDIFLTNGEIVSGNLADHFLTCAKLGRYLTVASGSRFIITDDLREQNFLPDAAALAAIYFQLLLLNVAQIDSHNSHYFVST